MNDSSELEPSPSGSSIESEESISLPDFSALTPAQIEEQFRALVHTTRRLQRETQHLRKQRFWQWRIRKEEDTVLAKALHGGPIQELSSLLFEINMLLQLPHDEHSQEALNTLKQNLKSAVSHLRSFINDLNSPALAHFGIQAAIRSTVESFQTKHDDLRIALFLDVEERPPTADTEWILHRILQQALRNIVQHAHARNIMVRLRRHGEQIELVIEDDGVGFELPHSWSTLIEQGKTGLTMAQIQAELLGGSFAVNTTPGGGTTVQVQVPFSVQENST